MRHAQPGPTPPPRVAPRDELVNVLEFEVEAARVLSPDHARAVTGSDRAAFDRVTFRPRMMVNCLDLNLSLDLFGASLFAPIIVGPFADQRRFHTEGELATVRGAGAGKAAVVVSSRASNPLPAIAAAASAPLFYQVFAEEGATKVQRQAREAERAGCKAIIVTVGPTEANSGRASRSEWATIDALRGTVALPVVVKGVTTATEATVAVRAGAQGLVVSTYGRPAGAGLVAPLDAIGSVVDTVGLSVPVLVDGGFRRGSDIMKALAFGARGVLVARPIMWGLAAYGAEGVQAIVEMLQSELGRVMACSGAPNLAAISRTMVRVHAARPPAL